MKKIAFLDRDGTLLIEPPITFQVNTLDEIYLLPGVISSLKKISEAGYVLAMITNQDGLGTDINPRENYEKINRKLFDIFRSEGIEFSYIFECPHLPEENCSCRKPNIGMVETFLKEENIDMEKSFVVGDRETDIEFAKNIGVKSFLLKKAELRNNLVVQERDGWIWADIASEVLDAPRKAEVSRTTKETDIFIRINLDGTGIYHIDTGLKFFDHMLEQLARHGNFDVEISCKGDLEIDEHHTIEDTALALGEAFQKALGDKRGIERYAWERILPMDEAQATLSLDISGRSYLEFSAEFSREFVGDFPTEMVEHFYRSFCDTAGLNLNISLTGKNTHHIIECSFKAFSRCLRDAVKTTGTRIPSTKGTL